MDLKTIVYRSQLLAFSIITSLLIFQYELIMTDRGVPLALSLTIYSISQIVIMLATFFWGKVVDHVKNKNRIIQVSLCIRLVITGVMFSVEQNTVFIALFLLYHTVSSCIDILFEGMLIQWAFNKKVPFGKFRLFGSIGYASSGLIASFIFFITQQVNYLLLFIFLVNVLILLGTFKFPVSVSTTNDTRENKAPIAKKYTFLLFLGAFITTLPNSFGVVLNNHYRETLGLGVEQAIFFAGIALLIGSFLSEVTGFFFVDRLIFKFDSKKVILTGMVLSCIRWMLALLATNPILFTLTYLFHGVSFAFIYIGCVSYIKERIGNEFTSKLVITFSLIAALIGFILTQVFSVVLSFYTTSVLLGSYIVVSLLITSAYYFYYWRD